MNCETCDISNISVLLNHRKTCDTYFISQVWNSASCAAVQNYILDIPTHTLAKLWMSAIMLRALLSNWNYYIYWWKPCKFISIIYSVAYEACYKIVIGERNITRDCLGTPMVGLQIASSFLKGHLNSANFFLSLKRSDSILITSPFALRPLWWGFWGLQQVMLFLLWVPPSAGHK